MCPFDIDGYSKVLECIAQLSIHRIRHMPVRQAKEYVINIQEAICRMKGGRLGLIPLLKEPLDLPSQHATENFS